MPEDAVDGKVAGRNGIHAHAACHERHVVHDARHHADHARDEIVVAVAHLVEPLAEGCKHVRLLQHAHCHENAEEEENGGEVDARKQLRDALLHGAVNQFVAVEDFRHRPQQAQHEQDAHKGRQPREETEHGHKAQAAHADEEHEVALPKREDHLVGVRLG